jgi:hypothetical protein
MAVPFKIKVTKEILELSRNCGQNESEIVGKTCAIAVALKDIFPEVFVSAYYIHPFGSNGDNRLAAPEIPLPKIAQDFVRLFDSFRAIPCVRLMLPEFEFEIAIPDEIIAEINIDEVRTLSCRQPLCL